MVFDKQIEGKVFLITGGTGSFGNAVLSRLVHTSISEIRILSRDEDKQNEMRKKYKNPKIKFYLGDIRDYSSVLVAMRGVHYVFHAAALKQVPSCEFYPMEATKTNVMGTDNVLEAAIICEVEKVICLSTDKAVYPINAMGISKALMEKVAVAKSLNSESTKICITRYGNVLGSRGSVLPLFVDQIVSGNPITVTDPDMTRFMMTLEEAVDLVIYAFEKGQSGDIFVQKSPSASIKIIAKALLDLLGVSNHSIEYIGTRHGEKLFEVLLSREERLRALDLGSYFQIPADQRDLNYEKFIEQGEEKLSYSQDYNSHNSELLNLIQVKNLLKKVSINKKFLNNNYLETEN